MIEKGRISSFQMGIILMYPTILGTAILIVPSISGKYAGRDLWLSPVWASSVGFLVMYVVYKLHQLYPKQTIIQYSEQILGVIPGKMLGFAYLLFLLHTTGIIFREYADFVIGIFLNKTPMVVGIGSLAMICAVAVRGGVEVLGRAAQVFFPLFVLPLLGMIIMLVPELKVNKMLPVLENGIVPSLMGALSPQAWFSEFMLASFLLPCLSDHEQGLKWGMLSVGAVMTTLTAVNLTILLLFGENSKNFVYPVLVAARYISIADFFEHLEAFVMAIWVAGIFVKVTVFYYALALGLAQWINLSDYRPTVLPLGLLLTAFAFWSIPSFADITHFLDTIFPFYGTFMLAVIPSLLLLIAMVRKGKRENQKAKIASQR